MSTAATFPRSSVVVFDTGATARTFSVIANPHEVYVLDDGEFLIESAHGFAYVARFTGRTRRVFGLDCPTIEWFDVDTFANEHGVILGRRGARLFGTLAVRPEQVSGCWSERSRFQISAG